VVQDLNHVFQIEQWLFLTIFLQIGLGDKLEIPLLIGVKIGESGSKNTDELPTKIGKNTKNQFYNNLSISRLNAVLSGAIDREFESRPHRKTL